MKNAERMLIASLRRYAALRGFELQLLSGDWVASLTKPGHRHLLMGYDLGLNRSAASRIASDKGATFDVLRAAGVPALEHRVFLHPRYLDFMPVDGNWTALLRSFADFSRDAVIKDNEGTGGMEVFRVRSLTELEQRAQQLFQIARGIALSPFVPIETETRFVMIDGDCVLAYAKERATLVGDGKQTVGGLLALTGAAYDNPDVPLNTVLPAGQPTPIQWRHNLGLGARARLLDASSLDSRPLLSLARQAMDALTLRFASIDIVTTGGVSMVLEANAGVMLEAASRPEFGGEQLADRIYHRAMDLALADQ